jgi:hypothetical protein
MQQNIAETRDLFTAPSLFPRAPVQRWHSGIKQKVRLNLMPQRVQLAFVSCSLSHVASIAAQSAPASPTCIRTAARGKNER